MAEKKQSSRAERAVSDMKKTTGGSSSGNSAKKAASTKASPKKKAAPSKAVKAAGQNSPSSNVLVSLVCITLFFLFAVLCINPDGAVLKVLRNVLLGILGQAGFYFSVPALLYLFVIHTFGRRMAVQMRSACTVLFVILCGCIFHLSVQNQGMADGLRIIPDLYLSGIEGVSGGVLCGGIALVLKWACGRWVALIICIVAAILALLGAMEITLPSIIRAIANRPRYEEEDEDEQEYIEPAALVVNHIANKRIEQKRQRNARMADDRDLQLHEVEILPQAIPEQNQTPPRKKAAPLPAAPVPEASSGKPARASGVMNTIDLDISTPVFGGPQADGGIVVPQQESAEDAILTGGSMPELEIAPPEFVMQQEEAPAPRIKPMPKVVMEPLDPPRAEKKKEKLSSRDTEIHAQEVAAEIERNQASEKPVYAFPPVELLRKPTRGSADGTEEMRENSHRLNETLASFNIDAHIINVTRGPSVTRYEVELDKGVRLNKLTGCADDIALSLGASGVRIAAVPGKISVVGIEVPNRTVTTVSLREVIDSNEFSNAKSKSSIGLGKSIDGNCVVGNIAKMPHLLIAGATGSGKSVCINSIVCSLLYRTSPDQVRMIMIDPKQVELSAYNTIPHLLLPVITDPRKAAGALAWTVQEMTERYGKFSAIGVRNMEGYNKAKQGTDEVLPNIVVIIDEMADLMDVCRKDVEESIRRLAALARAAGIYLVLATQRPSVDVITGVIKNNIPSRIAFAVSSGADSRTILDLYGAEKLMGKGDMLYKPQGGEIKRVQGCFVSDEEVAAITNYIGKHYNTDFDPNILEQLESCANEAAERSVLGEEDAENKTSDEEVLKAAIEMAVEDGSVSVSGLQRTLRLGHSRAGRIVDEMTKRGIVSPAAGSKPRKILISREQYYELYSDD